MTEQQVSQQPLKAKELAWAGVGVAVICGTVSGAILLAAFTLISFVKGIPLYGGYTDSFLSTLPTALCAGTLWFLPISLYSSLRLAEPLVSVADEAYTLVEKHSWPVLSLEHFMGGYSSKRLGNFNSLAQEVAE
jgi:hypothetical protein